MPSAVLLASLTLLPSEDFLVGRTSTPTTLTKDATGALLLSNGLISRRFVTSPNFATVSLRSEVSFDTGGVLEALRGVGPEARIKLSCGVGHRRGLLAYAAGARSESRPGGRSWTRRAGRGRSLSAPYAYARMSAPTLG